MFVQTISVHYRTPMGRCQPTQWVWPLSPMAMVAIKYQFMTVCTECLLQQFTGVITNSWNFVVYWCETAPAGTVKICIICVLFAGPNRL